MEGNNGLKWFCQTESTKLMKLPGFWTTRKRECEICGYKVRINTHHIIALSDGGAHSEKNVIILCPNHHADAHFGNLKIYREGEARYTEDEMMEGMRLFNKIGVNKVDTPEKAMNYIKYLVFIREKNFDRHDIIGYWMGIGRGSIAKYVEDAKIKLEDYPDFEPNKKEKIDAFLKQLNL